MKKWWCLFLALMHHFQWKIPQEDEEIWPFDCTHCLTSYVLKLIWVVGVESRLLTAAIAILWPIILDPSFLPTQTKEGDILPSVYFKDSFSFICCIKCPTRSPQTVRHSSFKIALFTGFISAKSLRFPSRLWLIYRRRTCTEGIYRSCKSSGKLFELHIKHSE